MIIIRQAVSDESFVRGVLSCLCSENFKLSFARVHAEVVKDRLWILEQHLRSFELSHNTIANGEDAIRLDDGVQAMSNRENSPVGEVVFNTSFAAAFVSESKAAVARSNRRTKDGFNIARANQISCWVSRE